MRHLFTYGPVPVDQADQVPLKDTTFGTVPYHWEIVRIEDVAKVQGGFAFKSRDYTPSGIRLLRISNVSFGKTVWQDVAYLPKRYEDEFQQFLLRPGDLVMAITRPVVAEGIKVTRLSEFDCPSLLNQRVCRFNPITEIEVGFLFQLIFLQAVKERIGGGADGSQQPNISTSKVEGVQIPLPPVQEQRLISNMLDAVDRKLISERNRLFTMKLLFQSLLHDLMTGKVRVRA
jgi:type I restriction enzyme S subunit